MVYPNPKQPLLGVFVRERARHVARHHPSVVVAPRPWFPGDGPIRGSRWAGVPREERDGDLVVHHPAFLSVPGVMKSMDAGFYAASLLPFLVRLRRQFPFDLIDAHFAYPDGAAAVMLGRIFRCPVTITVRGTIVPLSRRLLRRAQIRAALKAADAVFPVSETLKAAVTSLGVPADRVRVIPNGVDTGIFQPGDRSAARDRLGLPREATIVVSVASLSLRKGHQRVLDSLPAAVRAHPGLLYVAVGGASPEGDTGPLLRTMIAERGLGEHVRLVGARPHDEIPTWLQAADLFCLATSNEGRANVLIEALACGVPVVTTRIPANEELVEAGRDGLLVPLDEPAALAGALVEAARTPWDRADIARRAGARGWEDAATEVAAEFDRILSRRLPGQRSFMRDRMPEV
jgi:glycosyltransferase involved in cell wall biosynthesis